MQYTCTFHSSLGRLLLASNGNALTGCWFMDQKYFGSTLSSPVLPGHTEIPAELPLFDEVRQWLSIYFEGKDPGALPPISVTGTPFRLAVWDILKTIPYGKVVTYGMIAREMAARQNLPHMSAQAVGGAVGHNPISILIPCHRVIGANGNLTGYAGGMEKKRALLQLEGMDRSFLDGLSRSFPDASNPEP